jgi:hypothetical protein
MVIYFLCLHRMYIAGILSVRGLNMKRGPKAVIWVILLGMSLITVIQLVGTLSPKEEPADAKRMLYEASLFQVELLSGFVGEAANASGTEDLNGLKQAAYSVEYTHDRLLQAWGSAVPELHSVSGLMEFIVRLQIGGDRKLKPAEAELFAVIEPLVLELHEAYGALLTDGGLDNASAVRLKEADEAIAKLLSEQVK